MPGLDDETKRAMSRIIAAYSVVVALLSLSGVATAHADPVDDFYRGRNITLLIASGAAGGYDTYARVFARHVSRHIPGEPAIVPKNLPAAGGLTAANTLSAVSGHDGLTI